jgi:hypothetical protein
MLSLARLCIPFCVPFFGFPAPGILGNYFQVPAKKRNAFPCYSRNSFLQELCSCKNKFLFYPSHQNVTIPQHVDQKRVKDVTHNNTTRNKESLLPLLLAAPLICCPLRLAESFSCHIQPSLLHRTHLVWLVVVLLPSDLHLPLSRCLHLLSHPPFVGCRMASVLMPDSSASLPLSSRLCISLHCCTPLWFGWL